MSISSQAQELRNALRDLTKAGKATYVYADGYDTDTYIVASGAKHICMLEGGEIMIPGVGLETTFYKSLFDKVGVKADYVQIGEFKGADEEYTRTEASPELKGETHPPHQFPLRANCFRQHRPPARNISTKRMSRR